MSLWSDVRKLDLEGKKNKKRNLLFLFCVFLRKHRLLIELSIDYCLGVNLCDGRELLDRYRVCVTCKSRFLPGKLDGYLRDWGRKRGGRKVEVGFIS